MATANGFRSTPWIASSADWTRAWISIAGACLCQRSSRRSNAPSRKWPEPHVGSIIRKPSRGRSFSAGSSVRSRMCSSTKTGVWSSAYVSFACCDRSWYRSPRNRVDSVSSCRSWIEPAVVGSVAPELHQFLDGVTGWRRLAERGVRVDQGLRRGQFAEVLDRVFAAIHARSRSVLAEELQLGVRGPPGGACPAP